MLKPIALAAGLVRAAIGRFHDAGAAAGADDEAVARRLERQAPLGQLVRELARVLVVARPLDRLAAALQRGEVRRGPRVASRFAAARARARRRSRLCTRAEPKNTTVSWMFCCLKPAERLEVLGEDPERPRIVALEELRRRCTRAAGSCITRKTVSLASCASRFDVSSPPPAAVFAATLAVERRRSTAHRRPSRRAGAEHESPGRLDAAGGRRRRRRIRSPATRRCSPPGKDALQEQVPEVPWPGRQGRRPGRGSGSRGGHGPDQGAAAPRSNPDGVVFYKVVERPQAKPKMPAFKDELTKEQVWQIVAYAQTLRQSRRVSRADRGRQLADQ